MDVPWINSAVKSIDDKFNGGGTFGPTIHLPITVDGTTLSSIHWNVNLTYDVVNHLIPETFQIRVRDRSGAPLSPFGAEFQIFLYFEFEGRVPGI